MQAVIAQDFPIVMTVVIVWRGCARFLATSSDILYAVIDPRIRFD